MKINLITIFKIFISLCLIVTGLMCLGIFPGLSNTSSWFSKIFGVFLVLSGMIKCYIQLKTLIYGPIRPEELTPEIRQVVKNLLQEGKDIQAIKTVRSHTKLSLLESKAILEEIKKEES